MTQVYTCELQSLFGSENVISTAYTVDPRTKWVWTVWVCLYVDFFLIQKNIHVEHHMHDFVEVDNLSLHRYDVSDI